MEQGFMVMMYHAIQFTGDGLVKGKTQYIVPPFPLFELSN